MHVLIFSTPFVRNILILWRIQWAIIINLHTSSCKVLVILVRFEWNFNFLHRFFKNTQISNLMKICPVEARCSMRKDGQAERHDEANSCFSQFCECAWLWSYSCVCVCMRERERDTQITATALQDVIPGKFVGTYQWHFGTCLVQPLKYKMQEATSSSYTVACTCSTTITQSYTVTCICPTTINHIPEVSSWNMEIISSSWPSFNLISNYHKTR